MLLHSLDLTKWFFSLAEPKVIPPDQVEAGAEAEGGARRAPQTPGPDLTRAIPVDPDPLRTSTAGVGHPRSWIGDESRGKHARFSL